MSPRPAAIILLLVACMPPFSSRFWLHAHLWCVGLQTVTAIVHLIEAPRSYGRGPGSKTGVRRIMNHAQPHLTDITLLALDTETTGPFPIMHRLVEIGAVRFRLDGRELATFQMLIIPEVHIPPDVQQVHGVTDTIVRGKPTVEQIMPHFIDFLGEADTILLAHNALFDLGFLAMASHDWASHIRHIMNLIGWTRHAGCILHGQATVWKMWLLD
jgi:hypothetical protein